MAMVVTMTPMMPMTPMYAHVWCPSDAGFDLRDFNLFHGADYSQ